MAHLDEREVRSLGARAVLAPHERDPNHHLWRNGRLWWIAFTVRLGHLQERVRFSLKTADVEDARRRRDRIFAIYESAAQCRISIRLRTRSVGTPRESSRERR